MSYVCRWCLFVAAVAPRTDKITKNSLNVFERGENLLQNRYNKKTLHLDKKPIIRNRVGKLEFTQVKK